MIEFSRGSFTVRALARLINDVGVLRRPYLRYLGELYEHWAKQPLHPNDPEFNEEFYIGIAGRHLIRDVWIRACAVWDTVAALSKGKLTFVDERMPRCLDRAIQAVALSEERAILEPILWKANSVDSEADMDDKLQ